MWHCRKNIWLTDDDGAWWWWGITLMEHDDDGARWWWSMMMMEHDVDGAWRWWSMMMMEHDDDGACRWWSMTLMEHDDDGTWRWWSMTMMEHDGDGAWRWIEHNGRFGQSMKKAVRVSSLTGVSKLNSTFANIIECNGKLVSIIVDTVKSTQELKNHLLSANEKGTTNVAW